MDGKLQNCMYKSNKKRLNKNNFKTDFVKSILLNSSDN